MISPKTNVAIFIIFLFVSWASPVNEVSFALVEKGEPDTGKNHALIIGIGNYDKWPKLKSPSKDAEEIAKILNKKYDFKEENVVLLTDNTKEKPTRVTILTYLDKYVSELTVKDNILVFFSGHSTEDEKGETYWIPKDAKKKMKLTWLKHTDLCREFFASENFKAKNVCIITDSLFSNKLLKPSSITLSPYDLHYPEKIKEKALRRSREVISFGDQHWPGSKNTKGFGLFTYYLRKALLENWLKVIDFENLIFDEKIIFPISKIAGTKMLCGRLKKTPMEKGGQYIITRVISPPIINIVEVKAVPGKGYTGDEFLIIAKTDQPASAVSFKMDGVTYPMEGSEIKWSFKKKIRDIGKKEFTVIAKNIEGAVGSSKSGDILIRKRLLTNEYTTIVKQKDNTPPEIKILDPPVVRGIKIIRKGKKITVRGKAIDKSGIVEVLVDKKEAIIDKNGNFSADIYLVIGENQIMVSAMDRYENRSTKKFTVTRKSSSPVPTTTKPQAFAELRGWYEKQYAVVIGIDRYKNLSIDTLQNAVNDAKAVSRMFNKIGFEVVELYDERATKNAIIRLFSEIIRKARKNDSFVFYFAGHGQGFTLENRERVGYIIPYDADVNLVQKDIIQYDTEAIPLNTIKKYSKNIKAKHIALLFDSCFSGLAMKRSVQAVGKVDFEYYNDLLSRKVINLLTAGDDHPVSDGTGHSPFTQAILNGLAKKALDINDRDGFVTFNQLAVYVKEKVEKATGRRQRPQFDNLSMEDGDFIFKLR